MILHAQQIPPRTLPRGRHTNVQLKGLRYQRTLGKALEKYLTDAVVIPEPWYEYTRRNPDGTQESNICAPDFLLQKNNIIIVIEVKLTFVYSAIEKLNNLYVPIVAHANRNTKQIFPLIITRTITPSTPPTINRISQTLDANLTTVPILQWLGKNNPLIW